MAIIVLILLAFAQSLYAPNAHYQQLDCKHLSSCACIECLHLINPIYLSLHQRSSSLASLLLRVTFYRLKDGENFNDTEETIQKRIKTFNEETRPIIGDSSKFLATVSHIQTLNYCTTLDL